MMTATEARDAALARVEAGSDPEWVAHAEAAVERLAAILKTFSTDNVWMYLDSHKVEPPREPRALGPIMRRAVRDGIIRPVGYTQSTRRARHAAPIRTYERVPAKI